MMALYFISWGVQKMLSELWPQQKRAHILEYFGYYQNIDQMAKFNSAKCANFLAELHSFILKLFDLANIF